MLVLIRPLTFSLICVGLISLISCDGGANQSEPVEIKSHSVHTDLFAQPLSTDSLSWQNMYQNYGRFYPLLVEDILHIGPQAEYTTYTGLQDFVKDPFQKQVYALCDSVFNAQELSELDAEFAQAFGNWVTLGIDSVVPDIYYFHGGFNFGIISTDSLLGVGLEWWLGDEIKEYRSLPFPKYRVIKMKPEHLLPNAMKDWATARTGVNPQGENLLYFLIHYGKVMFLVNECLPETPDHEIMNLTAEEMTWFTENEQEIWNTMASQEVLFGSRPIDIQKWFVDGPNTGPLPQDSPPMAGLWIGWQMVNDYMSKTESATPLSLLQTHPEAIVAKYKPGN